MCTYMRVCWWTKPLDSGLSAAIEATRVDRKLHVTILEKLDACGGNSAKASSGTVSVEHLLRMLQLLCGAAGPWLRVVVVSVVLLLLVLGSGSVCIAVG